MVNTDDFIKRLEIILDYYGLSASSFADKIGVQRSGLSHLLSGRNKPSLDFILKIIEFFPEVDLYWILNGKGTFPKSDTVSTAAIQEYAVEENIPDLFSTATFSGQEVSGNEKTALPPIFNNPDAIERIVIFYKDGTFKNYEQQ